MSVIPNLTHILYKNILKKVLFLIDPEKVHDWFLNLGHIFSGSRTIKRFVKFFYSYNHSALEQVIFGINFNNPVGLAAGFDKDANSLGFLPSFGFGFLTVGSLTINSYVGNQLPRLSRLPRSRGIIVNYGLKNNGTEKVLSGIAENLAVPLVASLAKTNSPDTCNVDAGITDYAASFALAAKSSKVSMIEINISCPNAFGGEPFTTPERLEKLLVNLKTISCSKPITIKMPINLQWDQFKELLDIILKYNIQGVTIGNLNKDRTHGSIIEPAKIDMPGGVSGKPCFDLSNDLISKTYQYCGDRLVIIGVGGIFSAQDAYEKIKRGASLVELITGMIFEGPQLIGDINRGLVKFLEQDGFKNIKEAVGIYKK